MRDFKEARLEAEAAAETCDNLHIDKRHDELSERDVEYAKKKLRNALEALEP